MVNSNVPHFRSLVSVSYIESIVQVKIVILSSVRSNKHMMAPLSALCERSDYKLVHLNSRSYMYKGEIRAGKGWAMKRAVRSSSEV